ncbi:MAG: hypothetical protein Q9227_003658 [Pyrenula ochraceoflavens]
MPSWPPPIRSKLGLEDPRVNIVSDRGDKLYRHAHHTSQPAPTDHPNSPPNSPHVIQRAREQLEDGFENPAGSATRVFIPLDLLYKITNFETIYSIINSLSCCKGLSPADRKSLAQEVYSGKGNGRHHPQRKLLAVLIITNLHEDFIKFIKDGIEDSCLPLQVVAKSKDRLKCRNADHSHQAINEYKRLQRLTLSQWTYAVMAPYFTKPSSDQHVHYILDQNDVLPILQENGRGPSAAPAGMSSGSDPLAGAFSHVQRVKFHPGHFHFDSEDHPNENTLFALKKLNSANKNDFNKELASLLSCQNGGDKHLIKLLFTYEIKGAEGTDSSAFCLVFPWAQGDLWQFWMIHQAPSVREHKCVWMAEQCYQLVSALRHVHNERENDLKYLPDVHEDKHELYGRHGDVKAKNILWFQRDDILVMTDFGLGRLHSKISASNDTKSSERTATYRAPEFDTTRGKISRACDIYSIGCMFLEFVTWHLEGWKSVHDDFPQSRNELDQYKFDSDVFFTIEEHSADQRSAIRKSKVSAWITRLKQNPHCSEYHTQFLDLIEEHMLEPDAQKRIKAPKLERELRLFAETCRSDSSYYKEPTSDAVDHR